MLRKNRNFTNGFIIRFERIIKSRWNFPCKIKNPEQSGLLGGRVKGNNRFFLQLENPIQPLMILPFVLKMICSQSLNAWTHYLPVSNLSSLCILNHSNYSCPNHNLYQLLWTHQPTHKSLLSPVLNYSFMISRLSINPPQSSLFPDPSLPVFLFFQYYTFSSYISNKSHSCIW